MHMRLYFETLKNDVLSLTHTKIIAVFEILQLSIYEYLFLSCFTRENNNSFNLDLHLLLTKLQTSHSLSHHHTILQETWLFDQTYDLSTDKFPLSSSSINPLTSSSCNHQLHRTQCTKPLCLFVTRITSMHKHLQYSNPQRFSTKLNNTSTMHEQETNAPH